MSADGHSLVQCSHASLLMGFKQHHSNYRPGSQRPPFRTISSQLADLHTIVSAPLSNPNQTVERLHVTCHVTLLAGPPPCRSCVLQGRARVLQRCHRCALSKRLERFKETLSCPLPRALKYRSPYNEEEMETRFAISSRTRTALKEFPARGLVSIEARQRRTSVLSAP